MSNSNNVNNNINNDVNKSFQEEVKNRQQENTPAPHLDPLGQVQVDQNQNRQTFIPEYNHYNYNTR
jgi:hypothetical protein